MQITTIAAAQMTCLALDLQLPTGRTTCASWVLAGSEVAEVLGDIDEWAATAGYTTAVAKAFVIESLMAGQLPDEWFATTLLWLACRSGSTECNAAAERMAQEGGYTLGIAAEIDEELDWTVTAAASDEHPLRSAIEAAAAKQRLH